MIDSVDNFWAGTFSGISVINFDEIKFPFYQIEVALESSNFTHRIMQDSSGGFWFDFLRLGLGYAKSLNIDYHLVLNPEGTAL